MRTAETERKTNETDITVRLCLDGRGDYDVKSGSGFFDHMLEQFARHGSFDLYLRCKGDTQVDFHHSAEDCGIALGTAFLKALGEKRGICRYGWTVLPMDEALVLCAADLSGRTAVNFDVSFPGEYRLGDMDAELIKEFLRRSLAPALWRCTSKNCTAKTTTTWPRACSRLLQRRWLWP